MTDAAPRPDEVVLALRNLVRIPLRLIDPHPHNVRGHLGWRSEDRGRGDRVNDLDDLADSIREVGLIQPLTVVPNGRRFTVIAGHRRLAACKIAKVRDVPAVVRPDLTHAEVVEIMLVENLHRADLAPLEEARALKRLVDDGLTQETIAARIGRSEWWVSRRLILLQLPPEIQGRLTAKEITLTEATRIALHLQGRAPGDVDRGWDRPVLTADHLLGDEVRDRCKALEHGLRRRIGPACGECWEAVIRLDERRRLGLVECCEATA